MKTFVAKNITLINTGLSVHYNEYVRKKRIAKRDRVDKYELMKIAMAIFKEIGLQITETRGGVFIKNFGYFFIWKTNRKMTFGTKYKWNNKRPQYNHHSEYYRYMPVFYPAGGPLNLRFWTMDYKFHHKVKSGIKIKLKQGFKYRMYAHTLKKLLNL